MTTRKPPNMSFPDWVESQIQAAEREGAFQDLPGAGKPIPDIDRPQHDMDWIVDKLRRENVDIASVLPPALALAKEVELLPERLLKERTEPRVRSVADDLNNRIHLARALPQNGPPFRVRTVNVDEAVAQWQTARAQSVASPPPGEPVAVAARPTRTRSLFSRRRRAPR